MVIAASTLMLTGCDKAPPKTKTEKSSVIKKADTPPVKKPKTEPSSTESTASAKQSDPSAPTPNATYAPDAKQPFDALVYGTFSRTDKSPLQNAKLVFRTATTEAFTGQKLHDYVTVPLPPNGRYKIAVNSDQHYYTEITGDNITTATATIFKYMFSQPSAKSTSGAYKAEVKFDGALPETAIIEGKVLDSKGTPVPETFIAFVYTEPESSSNRSPHLRMGTSETTSTQDGTFRIQNAPTGTGTLFAKAPDFMPITLPSVQAPTSEPLTLTMNQKGASLTGRALQLGNESPIENATVSLSPKDSPEWADLTGPLTKYLTTTSDAAGNFEIKNLPPIPLHPGAFKTAPAMAEPVWLSQKRTSIQLNEGQTSDIKILLYSGHTVVGKVFDKESNEPLADVKVKTQSDKDFTVKSATDGSFRLPGIFTSQKLNVELEGYTTYDESINVNPSNPKNLDIELEIPMVQTIKISGMVKTKEGTPIPHAVITHSSNGNGIFTAKEIKVDSEGKFEIEVAPFSRLITFVKAEGYAVKQGEILELGVEDVTDYDIILEPGISLAGQVVDNDQRPIKGVRVSNSISISLPGGSTSRSGSTAETDLLGNFKLVDIAPDNDVRFNHEKYVYHTLKTTDYNLRPGESKSDIKVVLTEGQTISGTAKTESGKVPRNLYINLRLEGGDDSNGVSTDPKDGTFTAKNLKKGTYELYAYNNSFKPLKVDTGTTGVEIIVPDSPEPTTQKPESGETARLTGTIVDKKTKQPVTKYTLRVRPDAPKPVINQTNPSMFTLEGLTRGKTYELIVSSPDFIAITIPFDVPAHQEAFEKQFELESGGSVSGTLLSKSDKSPVENAVIQIWPQTNGNTYNSWWSDAPKPLAYTVSDKDGKFVIYGLKEGPAKLTIKPKSTFIDVTESLNITNDENKDMGEILLASGARISGKFTNSKGQPLAGKPIDLNSYTSERQFQKKTTTDEKGEYEFTNLPDSHYTVSSSNPRISVSKQLKNSQDEIVDLTLGEITLVAIIDSRKDQSLGSLNLSNMESNNHFYSQIKSDTRIEGLTSGKYRYSVSGRNGNSSVTAARGELTIPEEKEYEHTFQVPKGRINGILTDSTGKPVAGADITYKWAEATLTNTGPQYHNLKTQSDGTFALDYLETGSYTVTATTRDKGKAVKAGIIVGQNDVEVKLTLSDKTGTVESLAIDAETGAAIREAWCYLTDTESGVRLTHNAVRDESGFMKIPNVPQGEYQVEVSAWGFTSGDHRIKVEADKTVTVDDALYRAGALRWKLLKADGSPAPGVQVQVKPDAPKVAQDNRSVNTDGNGEAVVRGLSEGTYTLTATKNQTSISERFTIIKGEVTTKENTVKDW